MSGHNEVPVTHLRKNARGTRTSQLLLEYGTRLCENDRRSGALFQASTESTRPRPASPIPGVFVPRTKTGSEHHDSANRRTTVFFVATLRKPWGIADTPYPRKTFRLPKILSTEQVSRLIDAAPTLFYRVLLMTLYATGLRRAELAHCKSERHRQRTHGHSRQRWERPQRPRCHA